MNEQLTKLITDIQNQAPEVAAQITTFAVLSGFLEFAGCIAVMCVMAWVFFRDYDDDEDRDVARIVATPVAIVFLFVALFCLESAIQAKFFPKAFLAEKVLNH